LSFRTASFAVRNLLWLAQGKLPAEKQIPPLRVRNDNTLRLLTYEKHERNISNPSTVEAPSCGTLQP